MKSGYERTDELCSKMERLFDKEKYDHNDIASACLIFYLETSIHALKYPKDAVLRETQKAYDILLPTEKEKISKAYLVKELFAPWHKRPQPIEIREDDE